jgi:hypothetical protein
VSGSHTCGHRQIFVVSLALLDDRPATSHWGPQFDILENHDKYLTTAGV